MSLIFWSIAEDCFMERPIELKGVIQGKTITLDEESFLPDGYCVTLHLVLKPGEVFELVSRAGAHMTPEEIADIEQTMSDAMGYPFKVPEVGPQ